MASLRGGTSMTINTTWQSCRETKYFLECNFPNAQCVGLVVPFCFRVVRLFRDCSSSNFLASRWSWISNRLSHVHVLAPPSLAPEKQKLYLLCLKGFDSVLYMCFHFSSCRCIANSRERASHLSTSIPASPQLEEVRSGWNWVFWPGVQGEGGKWWVWNSV